MSQEASIALIGRYYAAFNAGDHDGMLACLSDNVLHYSHQGLQETGKHAFRTFLKRQDLSYVEYLSDIVIMASRDGRRASAEFIVNGEYRAQQFGLPPARGQEYELSGASHFTVDDGLISRISVYYNVADWLIQVAD